MSAQRIRLRDLRYYAVTGALFGGINALFAFGPKLIKGSLSLSYFPIGVAMFALIGVLAALPVGYFQLRRFRRRLAGPTNPGCPEARAPRAQFPRY